MQESWQRLLIGSPEGSFTTLESNLREQGIYLFANRPLAFSPGHFFVFRSAIVETEIISGRPARSVPAEILPAQTS